MSGVKQVRWRWAQAGNAAMLGSRIAGWPGRRGEGRDLFQKVGVSTSIRAVSLLLLSGGDVLGSKVMSLLQNSHHQNTQGHRAPQ